MKIAKIGASAVLSVTTTLVGTAVHAQSAGCAALDGFSAGVLPVRVTADLTTQSLDAGEVVTLNASSVSSSQALGTPVWAFADPGDPTFGGFGTGTISPNFNSSATPISESLTVPAGGLTGLAVTELGAWFTDLNGVTVTCTPAGPGFQLDKVATVAAANTLNAVQGALGRQFSARFTGSAENVATKDMVFFSTKGDADPDAVGWLSLSSRLFWDDYEGHSVDFLVGADWLVARATLVGLMVGLGTLDVDDSSGASTDADALTLGVYAAHQFPAGFRIDGYLAYSAVDYDANGTDLDTDRYMGGLTVSGTVALAAGTLTPRSSLLAAYEDFPAGTGVVTAGEAQRYQLSVGARFDGASPIPGTGLMPYGSLDVEFASYEDSDGDSFEYVAPRVGLGVAGGLAGGTLGVGLDIGQSAKDVYDAGLRAEYVIRF